jgi:hypothetical protein
VHTGNAQDHVQWLILVLAALIISVLLLQCFNKVNSSISGLTCLAGSRITLLILLIPITCTN